MKDKKLYIDKENFKEVFDRYFPSLCVFAQKFLNDEDAAKDVVQDTMLKLWKSDAGFDDERAMRVYFYMSTKHACLDYIKKEKRRRIDSVVDEDTVFDESNVMNEIIREETYRLLEETLKLLPAQSRKVLELNMKGLNNNEVAEELGLSINTIKTHKLAAYRKLRQLWSKEFVALLLIELNSLIN